MNKKTYILGFVALALLAGIVWHANRNQVQTDKQISSILSAGQEALNQTDDDFVIGSPEAKVTIIEYSSHFCGFCADFHKETLPVLVDKYIKTGQVKLISRFISPKEIGLAISCAQDEDRFSEMSEYFFEHISEIESADDVKVVALQVVSDKESFEECYNTNKYGDRVQKWFDQAGENEVAGTPTFFINGQKVVGNQPITEFEKIIEAIIGEDSE